MNIVPFYLLVLINQTEELLHYPKNISIIYLHVAIKHKERTSALPWTLSWCLVWMASSHAPGVLSDTSCTPPISGVVSPPSKPSAVLSLPVFVLPPLCCQGPWTSSLIFLNCDEFFLFLPLCGQFWHWNQVKLSPHLQ